MNCLGIIGGSGLYGLDSEGEVRLERAGSPFGAPSGPLNRLRVHGRELVFIARHGEHHTIPPHAINYRANVWALKTAGVEAIVAVNAVGSIRRDWPCGTLVVPDQLIDHTWGRAHTFFEKNFDDSKHVDFTWPFDSRLRGRVLQAVHAAGEQAIDGATLVVTQGPRLETRAEIDAFEKAGGELVGMTTMPEAALAREAGLPYATLALVVNPAAGRQQETITMEGIRLALAEGMERVQRCLQTLVKQA